VEVDCTIDHLSQKVETTFVFDELKVNFVMLNIIIGGWIPKGKCGLFIGHGHLEKFDITTIL